MDRVGTVPEHRPPFSDLGIRTEHLGNQYYYYSLGLLKCTSVLAGVLGELGHDMRASRPRAKDSNRNSN